MSWLVGRVRQTIKSENEFSKEQLKIFIKSLTVLNSPDVSEVIGEFLDLTDWKYWKLMFSLREELGCDEDYWLKIMPTQRTIQIDDVE